MRNFTTSPIVIDVMKEKVIYKIRVTRANAPELLRDWWSFAYEIVSISVFGRKNLLF
jgi:hypothetical protein